jgi:phosphohistidine phosphatase
MPDESTSPSSPEVADSRNEPSTEPATPPESDDAESGADTTAELPPSDAVVDEAASPEPARPAEVWLYLLRHGDAGDPMAWTGDDAERPLSKKGRRQSKRLGRLLAELDVRPDVILTSPKLRAAETAKLVGRLVGRRPAADDRLSIGFGESALAAIVSDLGDDSSVMLVGHDPDFSATLSWLVDASLTLRKGALALVVLPDRAPGAGRGVLRWLLPPDALPG